MPKVAEVPTPEISLSKGPNETDVDNDVADKLSQNSQSLERALERVMDDELQIDSQSGQSVSESLDDMNYHIRFSITMLCYVVI